MRRLPFLLLAGLCMILGIWGGWLRLQIPLPAVSAPAITFHGPLMVCGFLGTLIGVERAVALRNRWFFLGPLLSGGGAISLLTSSIPTTGQLMITAGSIFLMAASVAVWRRSPTLAAAVMVIGAGCWLIGNMVWLAGAPVASLIGWWGAFLLLIIAGERLELSRFQGGQGTRQTLFLAALFLFLVGTALRQWAPELGTGVSGLGMLALAGWLLTFDIARRNLSRPGLPRFAACSLLTGYFWLAVSGALTLAWRPTGSGLSYDAALHSLFLGFVISMVFGHAPIIFPSILGVRIPFSRVFYGHLALLHLSVLLRLGGDSLTWPALRLLGGLLNGAAIGVFVFVTLWSAIRKHFEEASKLMPASD